MPLSPLRLRILVASLLSVAFLGALDHTAVSTSLATIAGELDALEHMSWVVVGYTLASTVMLPVLGRLGDVLGPKRVFLISLAVFLLASLTCGFAQTMPQLVLARVVQGMSSAGIQLMSQTIVAHVTTPRERPKYLGIIGAAFPIAILLGPVVGGLITDFWGWQWVFWINLPIGLAAFVLAAYALPHVVVGDRRGFDLPGAVTFTIGLVSFVLAVTWMTGAETWGASLACFAVAAVSFAVFFVIELRVASPVVPLRLLRNRTIWAGLALSAIIGIGIFSVTAYLPTYFQMAYMTSATVSALVPIATVVGMLVGNTVTGWLASTTGYYRIYMIAGTAMGALGLGVMAALPTGLPLTVPMIVMGVVGLGTGAFMNLVVAVVQSAAPAAELGAVTASINLVRQVGSTVTTAVIGGLIATGVAARLPAALDPSGLTPDRVHAMPAATQELVAQIYTDVLSPIFVGLAAVYVLGVVAAIAVPAGRLSDDALPHPAEAPAVPATLTKEH